MLGRAIEHFAALGLKAPEAVMSDNAFAYRRSNAFRADLAAHGARHILIPPYTPRWNGKVERFIQTLKREWAYAHSWPNSAERSQGPGILPSLLQPASPAQLTGRPAADQPRSQRPWVGQLVRPSRSCRGGGRPGARLGDNKVMRYFLAISAVATALLGLAAASQAGAASIGRLIAPASACPEPELDAPAPPRSRRCSA